MASKSLDKHFKAAVKVAQRFPGVEVETSYGTPALKVKGKFMARLRTEAEGWLAIRCDFIDREILLQAAPDKVAVEDLNADLAALDTVTGVHDVHVWTLTSGMEVATAHLLVEAHADTDHVLARAGALFQEHYGIEHATIQVERWQPEACKSLTW